MRRTFSSLSILAFFMSTQALALPPVIYGDDNRKEIYEVSELWQKRASAVAVMVHRSKLIRTEDEYKIDQKSFKTWLEEILNRNPDEDKSASKLRTNLEEELGEIDDLLTFCPEERFTNQPVPGDCTGFLIAPDLILTAGHCAEIENFCEGHDWVFDFKMAKNTKLAPESLPAESVFTCKRVIRKELNLDLGLDYALVQLDRNVRGRDPLVLERESRFTQKSKLTVIGSPSGLPLKISQEGKLRSTLHPFFIVSTLDTYKGNSGSPVFNSKTGLVGGILVRGEEDFIPDHQRMCLQSKRCEGDECQGESVSKILSIPEISYSPILFDAVIANDLETLTHLNELRIWMDMPTSKGLTPLMQAMRYPHLETLEKLLLGGADPTRIDRNGEGALHHLAQVLGHNSQDVLDLLIQHGASLEIRNLEGETPILKAARWLNREAVKLLIKAGADFLVQNSSGEGILTPFKTIGDYESVEDIQRTIEEKTLADDVRID